VLSHQVPSKPHQYDGSDLRRLCADRCAELLLVDRDGPAGKVCGIAEASGLSARKSTSIRTIDASSRSFST
jgi:hypothetical protein